MDPRWMLFFGLALVVLDVLVTSGANRTSSTRLHSSESSRRYGESKSYRWLKERREDPDDDGSRKPKAKCVDIPQTMNLCRGIGYLKMRLPNLLEHQTLTEVQRESASWTSLLTSRCNANTQLFLCSLFSPVCLDQPIWPCRSLCLEVKRDCEARMASRGHPWPEMLNCGKFPSDHDLCIAIQSNRSNNHQHSGFVRDKGTAALGRTQSSCRICQNISSGVDSITNNICNAGFVARIKPEIAVITGNDLKLIAKKKAKFLKSPTAVVPHKRRQTFYVISGAKCDCFDPSYAAQYLVKGHVTDKHRMVITSAVKFDAKSKVWRKTVRTIKKANKCRRSDSKNHREVMKSNRKSGKLNKQKTAKTSGKKKEQRIYGATESHKAGSRGNSNEKQAQRKPESTKRKNRQSEHV